MGQRNEGISYRSLGNGVLGVLRSGDGNIWRMEKGKVGNREGLSNDVRNLGQGSEEWPWEEYPSCPPRYFPGVERGD